MIYLDNAATTFPKPQTVLNAVTDAVKIHGGNPGRSGHLLSMNTSKKIFDVRESIADFFGGSSERVVFTSNCTQALNFAIKGIMSHGGHIILSNFEHNSVIRPIYSLAQKKILEYDIATVYENDKERTINSFAKLIRANTVAVVCTHSSNVTGLIMPIREIGALCRKANVTFIVDAAQTAGVIPINLAEMNIDILCTAGHKCLYGITGTGLMLINTDKFLDTIMEGGTGSTSIELSQPDFFPDRFESGTINTVGILSLGAGIEHIKSLGIQRIYSYEFSLCKKIYEKIQSYPNVITYIKDYKLHNFTPIVLFNIKGKTSTEIVNEFSSQGICLRGGLHCSPLAHSSLGTTDIGAVRIAPSIFTSEVQIAKFLELFDKIAKK